MRALLLAAALLCGPVWAQDGQDPGHDEVPATERLAELERRLDQVENRLAACEAPVAAPSALPGAPGGVVVERDQTVREAFSFGGPVIVHGQVRGAAVAFGGDVQVHDGGSVQGDAVSFGGQVLVQDGGHVSGDKMAFSSSTTTAWLAGIADPSGVGRALLRRLVLLLTFAGGGVLVVGLFPDHISRIAADLQRRPLRAGLAGAVATSVAVLCAAALAVTLVGLPLSLLLLVLLGLAWALGFIGLCQVVGDGLPIRGVGARRWTAFLIGVAALAFAGALPSGGQLLLVALGLFGAGAAIQTRLGTRDLS